MPKANSRRLDKDEKNVLVHLLQAPKLTNGDIAKIIDVDERTISRRRKQLRTLGHLSPERNVKGAEKLKPWHLERIISLLDENNDLQLKDVQEFLQAEFDLHVTVSTISRQLARANHARARRPGYKSSKRPNQVTSELQFPLHAQVQPVQDAAPSRQHQAPDPALQLQGDAVDDALPAPAVPQQHQHQHRPLMLACPFYKRNPQAHLNSPFCQSSWPTARDVKEHVYRQHMPPKFRCNRCLGEFADSLALVSHQRTVEPCPLREWMTTEVCSEEQRERIRKGDRGSESDRWKRMFRILFPDIADEYIPDGSAQDTAYLAAAIDPGLGAWQDVAPPVNSAP